jgi:hypothetical protein
MNDHFLKKYLQNESTTKGKDFYVNLAPQSAAHNNLEKRKWDDNKN